MNDVALLAAENLFRLDLPHKRTELVRGRLVVREPGGARHGAVAMRLGFRIMTHVEARNLGRVYAAETGFKIASTPDTVRAPDVSFVATHHLPEVEPAGYPDLAPDLAVEVLGHDDHPGDILEKVGQWLRAGVRRVWTVDSERHHARVYWANGSESLLGPAHALVGEDVLPGFRCPLTEVW